MICWFHRRNTLCHWQFMIVCLSFFSICISIYSVDEFASVQSEKMYIFLIDFILISKYVVFFLGRFGTFVILFERRMCILLRKMSIHSISIWANKGKLCAIETTNIQKRFVYLCVLEWKIKSITTVINEICVAEFQLFLFSSNVVLNFDVAFYF